MDPSSRRVVVTGLGAVASLGHEVETFWAALLAGRSGVDRVSLFDPTPYASHVGAEVRGWDPADHMDPKEARRNDRYTHFGFCRLSTCDAAAALAAVQPVVIALRRLRLTYNNRIYSYASANP